jgi:hypothetical protein
MTISKNPAISRAKPFLCEEWVMFPIGPTISPITFTLSTPHTNLVAASAASTFLTICDLEADISNFPDFWQHHILEHRKTVKSRTYPDKFPATITIETFEQAKLGRIFDYEQEYNSEHIVYFTDGAYMYHTPRSATGGVVTIGPWRQFRLRSLSHDMDQVSGSEEAELLTLNDAVELALKEAQDRADAGVYVTEMRFHLDPKSLLQRLQNMHYSNGLSQNFKELFRLARLVDDANIELKLYWCPKQAKVRPHTEADRAATGHRAEEMHSAKTKLSEEDFAALKILPSIQDRSWTMPDPVPNGTYDNQHAN